MDTVCIRKLLGQRVKSLRETRRYSQEALAQASELNRSYIGSVERGEHNVGIENIEMIAHGLDIPVHELFVFDSKHIQPREKLTPAHGKTPGGKGIPLGQFFELLRQNAQSRPDLVVIYLQRFGIHFDP